MAPLTSPLCVALHSAALITPSRAHSIPTPPSSGQTLQSHFHNKLPGRTFEAGARAGVARVTTDTATCGSIKEGCCIARRSRSRWRREMGGVAGCWEDGSGEAPW